MHGLNKKNISKEILLHVLYVALAKKIAHEMLH